MSSCLFLMVFLMVFLMLHLFHMFNMMKLYEFIINLL